MKKHKVWLGQINYTYGSNSMFLPYSVGMLEAYARGQAEIEEVFSFQGYLYRREPIDDVIARIEGRGGIDVLGLSIYLWNEKYSSALADAVRARFPETLIVIGGPQVNRRGPFGAFPAADLAVFGEGEFSFADILRAASQFWREQQPTGAVQHRDLHLIFGSIAGLGINSGGWLGITGEPDRIADLSQLPSPYLTGCFNTLLADRAVDWQASFESNRGCPYSCSFCAWGPESLAKIHQFPDARIMEELQWFGEHQIRYVYSCDANYGILKRDVDITRLLVETKKLFGFPKEFRACTAKNSNDRVFEISKILNEAGMCKGATLSFQSMDPHTLQIIKRKNIKIDDFADRLQLMRQHGIASYTELIMGLPGETKESFEAGIDTILDAGKHEGLNVYLCQVLPQTDFDDPAYREAHEIVAVRSPLLMQHSSPTTDPHQEYNDIIIANRTLGDDFVSTYMFAWAVQTFHCLGLTRFLAMFARQELGLKYSQFYAELLSYACTEKETHIGEEYHRTIGVCTRGMSGGDWGQVDQHFGNIVWPTEEMSFLRLITDHAELYRELRVFMHHLFARCSYSSVASLLDCLIAYQQAMMIRPDDGVERTVELMFDCHSYFGAVLKGEPISFNVTDESLLIQPSQTYESLVEYARRIVWFGRKGGRFTQHKVICYSNA